MDYKRVLMLVLGIILLNPSSNLAQPLEKMWGVTSAGGESGLGAVYSANVDATGLAAKGGFPGIKGNSPQYVKLIEMSDGALYGTTLAGGVYTKGIIFRYFPESGVYEALVDFDGVTKGSYPYGSLVSGGNGKLYGVTSEGGINGQGVFFEFDPATKTFTKRHDFDGPTGANPFGDPVLGATGSLYGVTQKGGASNNGTIYEYNIATATLIKKKDMVTSTGTMPFGGLVSISSDKLLGMANEGGAANMGTLYEYDRLSNSITKRVDFSGPNGKSPLSQLLVASSGLVYGMTFGGGSSDEGTLFEYNTATFTLTKKIDFAGSTGIRPYGGLMQASNGKLYGCTEQGLSGYGGIFEFNIQNGLLNVLASFQGSSSGIGASPRTTPMQASNGKVYGVASDGGLALRGTIFELNLVTNTVVAKVSFGATTEGDFPVAPLAQHSNGRLYAASYSGGASRTGVLYEFNMATNTYTRKQDIDFFSIGGSISTAFCEVNGLLYGTAPVGGSGGSGTLFSYNPATNVITKLHDFSSLLGQPAGVIQASNGKLYGGTADGGSNSSGIIFEYDINTQTFTTRADFNSSTNGNDVAAPLVEAGTKLYGVTQQGGTSNSGTLFEFDPATGALTKKIDFTGSNGMWPVGSLALAPNGNLFGVTQLGGLSNQGTIFEYNPSSNILVVRHSFSGATIDGVGIEAGLSVSPQGKLFGITRMGGSYSLGTLYEFDPVTYAFTKKVDFDGSNGASPYRAIPLFVSMSTQTVSFDPLPSKVFGNPSFTLTATASTGLPITFLSLNTDVATISGNTLTIVGAGSATIKAIQYGNKNYLEASVDRVLVVDKAMQEITFGPLPAKERFDPSFSLTASSNRGLPVNYSSSNTGVATVSGNTATLTGVGNTTLTASNPGNQNYLMASATQTLVVNKASQTVSFTLPVPSPVQSFMGPLVMNPTASSQLPVTITSNNPAVATVSGNIVTLGIPGTVTLTAFQGGNEDYLPASTNQELVVAEVTGIEPSSDGLPRIYPNPVNQQLFVQLPLPEGPEQYPVNMVDILGKQKPMILQRVAPQIYSTQVDELPPGVYFLDLKPGMTPLKLVIAR